MAQGKAPPKGSVQAVPAPDALDLLDLEKRIEGLEKSKAEIESKSAIVPGRSKQLDEITRTLHKLRWAYVSAQEHVRVNPAQSEIYEREKDHAKRDTERQRLLEEKMQAADRDGGESYREKFRAYVAKLKNKPKEGTSLSDGQESEPG